MLFGVSLSVWHSSCLSMQRWVNAFGKMEHTGDRCGADAARSRVDTSALLSQDVFKKQTEMGGGRIMDGREWRRKTFRDIKYDMRSSYRCTDMGNKVWWSTEQAAGRVEAMRRGMGGRREWERGRWELRQWCGLSWEVMSCWSDNKLQMEAVRSPLACVCHGLHHFCGEGTILKDLWGVS